MLGRMAPYAAIQYIRKRIGYDDFLKDYAYTNRIERSDLNEILAELEESAKQYASIEEWFVHIGEYTEVLRMKERQKNMNQEGVRLMTLHAAKGLEFDTVFLIETMKGEFLIKRQRRIGRRRKNGDFFTWV